MNWRPTGIFTSKNSEVPSKLMISDDEAVQTSMPKEDVFLVVEEMPEFPGGVKAIKNYIKENIQYPFSALKDKIEGKVYVNFIVDKFGSVNNFRIARGLNDALDKAAVYVLSQMPAWKPGKQRGRAVSVSYTVPVEFALKDSVLTDEEIRQSKVFEEKIKDLKYDSATRSYTTENKFIKEFEKNAKDDNFQKITVSDVDRYVFSASQFGWINCDRFVDTNNPKTNYSILIDEPDKTIVNVIFHRFKAIVPGSAESNRIIFKDVPVGEKITIVALKTIKNKVLLAVKETVITDKEETGLDFQPVTMDLQKKAMEKLNKLN
jgi:TonB family protein